MTNNERFFDLYREIENELTAGRTGDMMDNFRLVASSDVRLSPYIDEMINFRSLRNIEAHRANANVYYTISDETVRLLSDILRILKNPMNAERLAVPIQRLVTASLTDSVLNILNQMAAKPFSNIPIVDQKHRLLGVLSDNVILHLLHRNGGIILPTLSINEIRDLVDITHHIKETYVFIARKTPLNDLVGIFQNPYRNGKRIAALFVTENGTITESVLGMITPMDVLTKVNLR